MAEEELTDDTPVKQELMELQMQLELGDITTTEYVRREAELMVPLPRGARVAASGSARRRPAARCASRAITRRGVTRARRRCSIGCRARRWSSARAASARRRVPSASPPCSRAAANAHSLLSTDPAAALADVHRRAGRRRVRRAGPSEPELDARQLSAAELRHDFLARWRDMIAEIVDRGTYLDRDDVDGLVDAALPGADEIFALLALADLLADASGRYARIVVDTAPTGHTLRLLALPETFRALVSLLD